MEKKYFLLRRENIILIFCLLVIFSIYVVYLTKSGLWYDEGIEYFYSKYLGVLPEGVQVNAEGKTNMYMRICSTFQPPLYNVLLVASIRWSKFFQVYRDFVHIHWCIRLF